MMYCACWEEYALKSVGHQNILPQAFHCIGVSRLLSSYSFQTWLSYSKFDICLHSNMAHRSHDLICHKVGFYPLHSHNRRENHSLYRENKNWEFIIVYSNVDNPKRLHTCISYSIYINIKWNNAPIEKSKQ